MSDLVNHVQAVTFRNFEESISNGKCFHMSSFGESKAEEFFRDPSASIHFVKYNVKQISRYTGTSYWRNECWVLTVAMIRGIKSDRLQIMLALIHFNVRR